MTLSDEILNLQEQSKDESEMTPCARCGSGDTRREERGVKCEGCGYLEPW